LPSGLSCLFYFKVRIFYPLTFALGASSGPGKPAAFGKNKSAGKAFRRLDVELFAFLGNAFGCMGQVGVNFFFTDADLL
jgi:hypothetical protein